MDQTLAELNHAAGLHSRFSVPKEPFIATSGFNSSGNSRSRSSRCAFAFPLDKHLPLVNPETLHALFSFSA
jgi:hypothetical protein